MDQRLLLGVDDPLGEVERDGVGAFTVANDQGLGDRQRHRESDDEVGSQGRAALHADGAVQALHAAPDDIAADTAPGHRPHLVARAEARREDQIAYRRVGQRRVGRQQAHGSPARPQPLQIEPAAVVCHLDDDPGPTPVARAA